MKRRSFIASAAALLALPTLASAEGFTDYTPGAIKAALDSGKTVLVDYSATWCSTCKRQERVINALRAADPAYDANLTFIKVDWDTYSRHDVTQSRNIPRRSTLIVLRGDQELGRIIAGTAESQIKALMDTAL
ncbi:thioredoxin family protein [Planktotalea sp.]|uniref:thioredoxin family protein n=1 Tax=Planktotalea sp. TaxID=2029877 RepID=UPI0032968117